MKVSGFTIVRNAAKFQYPMIASINSILPICDEFIVNVGDSDDGTLELVRSIGSPKVRVIQSTWNMGRGPLVLSEQTNIALSHCTGDWAFYLQSDEVIHEQDLPKVRASMEKYLHDPTVDALRFKWLHFYGSFWRYRIDAGWYQKQDRIIRNNKTVESFGDAFGFSRRDGKPLQSRATGCLLYHYGWVNSVEDMTKRSENAARIGYGDANKPMSLQSGYGDLDRFPVYYGSHPAVMRDRVGQHALSCRDWAHIWRRYWWHPALWLRLRFKTGKRVRKAIS
jgi:glycosyltransferase involved in cell wall biosynthesis